MIIRVLQPSVLCTAGSLAFATLLAGQQPYGDPSTGSGGFVPQLSSAQPRVGAGGFGFDLQSAAGSVPAFLLLGLAPGNVPILGVDLLVDPASVLAALQVTTSAGGAGAGRAVFPLGVPNDANLLGASLYAQAIVIDGGAPQGVATSRGLRATIRGAPQVFVACSIIGSDPFQLVDPVGGTMIDTGSPAEVDNVSGAAFDRVGQRVFTASGIRGTIGVGDLSTLPIMWSTLWSAPATSTYGLQADGDRQLVWTLAAVTGGSRELVAIDVDRASPSHGTMVHATNGMLSGNAEIFDLAPSGDLAAVLTYLPDSLTIVDTDPASSTFLQNVVTQVTIPVDQSSPFTLSTRVAITPDERYVLVMLQGAGPIPAEIARFDVATQSWVDHNGAAPGQNIGPMSNPPIAMGSAPTSIAIASHGRFAIVGGFGGCGWVGRLDLDPNDPQVFAFTPFIPTLPLQNGWTTALSNDETEIAVATWPDSRCAGAAAPELVRFDVATGAQIGTVPIPANTNGSNQNLYTLVYR